MKELTVSGLEAYLRRLYYPRANEQGMFMKLVEEIGEVAEILNRRAGRKAGEEYSDPVLAKELADVIHYAVAIAAINGIDMAETILEKDRAASVKYGHEVNLETFLAAWDKNVQR